MPINNEIKNRWACVKQGKVDMVIIWDGINTWPPSENYTMVKLSYRSAVSVGWDYIDGEFIDNRPVLDEFRNIVEPSEPKEEETEGES